MRKLLVGLLLFVGVSANSANLAPQTIRDFSAGLVTDEDSAIIPDGAAQDLQNVVTTDKRIEKRLGSVQVNATALGGFTDQEVRFLHEFVDNSGIFHLLAISSNSLLDSTDGGSTWSLLTSTHGITSSSRFSAANAFGNCYLIDGSTNAIVYDGTSVTQNTAIPIGQDIEFFAGRLWVSNGSILYASRVLVNAGDDSDWTEDGVDDADATSAAVRYNDGYDITALKAFGSDLFVFKARSIDRVVLRGDGLNFTLLPLTSHVGTVHARSVVVADNAILWLGSDGYYGYDNSQIRRISENITPTVSTISQLSSLSRSYSETDMTSGTDDNTTGERVAGQVMLSALTSTDTDAVDFASGTLVSFSTNPISGTLRPSVENQATLLDDFSDGDLTASPAWSLWSDGTGFTPSHSIVSNTLRVVGSGGLMWTASTRVVGEWNWYFPVVNEGATLQSQFLFPIANNILSTGSPSLPRWVEQGYSANISGSGLSVWRWNTGAASFTVLCTSSTAITPAQLQGSTVTYRRDGAGYMSVSMNGVEYCSATDTTYSTSLYTASDNSTSDTSRTLGYYIEVDNLDYPSATISGSFVSRAFDTGLATPTWQSSGVTQTLNGHSFSYYTAVSSDAVTWDTTTTWTVGSAPTSASKQYIRYTITFTTSSTTQTWPFISDVTLSALSGAGRYLSPSISTTNGTTWLPIQLVGDTDGGSITYELYVDTDTSIDVSDAGTFTSSQTVTSGQTPSLTIGSVAFLAATMTVTAGGQDPSVQEWTLRWGEGSVSNLVTSVFYDQKYYSSVSVGGTDNDTIFVFDRNGAWNVYKDLPAAYMMRYRDSILFGLENDGYVVRMEEPNTYQDYNGNAISCYWLSKDFDLGYPITDKTLLRYYLTGRYNADANVTFGYGVNRGSLTSASYPMTDSGFFREVIIPSSLTYQRGIQHRFRISDSTLDAPMAIDSVTGLWRLETAP